MARFACFVLALGICLCTPTAVFGVYIETYGYVAPGDDNYVGWYESLDTWWHDGGPPINATTPDDSIDVLPDKNHDVGTFTEIVAPTALVASYMRKLSAEELITVLPTVSYGDIFGNYLLGEYQDLTGATDHYFPPETVGRPLHVQGEDGPSGVTFYDVADEMLVQFFSSDKNDGYIEIVLNDTVILRLDTWTQGWWYFRLVGLDPDVADKVELRTWWNDDDNVSWSSNHINTLDLNPNSQNWAHKLPGEEGYPIPDDFHIFFIAYNYVEVPEPATLVLLGAGVAGAGAWLRRRKRLAG